MDAYPLQRVEATALRVRMRQSVPFGLRVGIRRLPAILAWLGRRSEVRCEPIHTSWPKLCARRSPLRRPGTIYAPHIQAGKEANVRRAADALHGAVVPPGEIFSWHALLGPPLRVRGFEPGPELHEGELSLGAGGGVCQVANLLFWLGAMSGMEVIERHRHRLDLFPDHQRTVPFGCGATVFYPHLDLKLRNPHRVPLQFSFWIIDGFLEGSVSCSRPLLSRYSLEETDHQFVRSGDQVWRCNTIIRRIESNGSETVQVLAKNQAVVQYPVNDAVVERT